jgi:GNAT superfamily N-acetyltransferase
MVDLNIRPLGRPGDLGWVVQAHGELYFEEFGWDTGMEALVARIVADYAADTDHRRAAWIAERADGTRLGCVFCVPAGATTAKLRILLVQPDGRGHGLGRALVDTCVDHARAQGFELLRLWTNDVLAAARRIYVDRGFTLVATEPHHSFGHDLVGQTYELNL